jgi:hypothetical protein
MSTVTTKQGQPSKPGEVVDTSAAKIVPPSSEVKAETNKRGANPKPKKPAAKPEPKAKARPTGKTVKGNAFTKEWIGKNGKPIAKGDKVKDAVSGIVGVVTMRWTRPKDRVPCVSVEPTSTSTDAVASVMGGRSVETVGIPVSQLTHTQ